MWLSKWRISIEMRQQDPTNFSLELVFWLWFLSCEVGFSMGSCWRIKLWGLENCTRALFDNGSIQRNVTCRDRANNIPIFFFFFTFVMYPTRGFKICFPFVWDKLGAHFYTYWKCNYRLSRVFTWNFNIFTA